MRVLHAYHTQDVAEKVDESIEYMKRKLAHCAPTFFYLTFKCRPNEYRLLRKLLSIPWALSVAYIINWIVVSKFPFPPSISSLATQSVIASIAAGYVLSVQFRTILWLSLPTMVAGVGRSFFYLLLAQTIIKSLLLDRLYHIIESYIRLSLCLLTYTLRQIFWRYRLRTGPLVDMFLSLITGERLDMYHFSWNDAVREMMVQIRAQMNETQTQTSRQLFDIPCENVWNAFEEDCTDLLKFVPIPLLWIPTVGYYIRLAACRTAIRSLLDYACVRLREDMFARMNAATDELGGLFGGGGGGQSSSSSNESSTESPSASDVRLQLYMFNQTIKWDSFDAIQQDILHEYTIVRWSFVLLDRCLNIILVALFFTTFLSANSYHRQYHRSMVYDNRYVDHYFRSLDRRRKRAGKVALLPLRGADRQQLHQLYSPWLSSEEWSKIWISFHIITILVVISALLTWIIVIASDYLNAITDQLNVIVNYTAVCKNEPKFSYYHGSFWCPDDGDGNGDGTCDADQGPVRTLNRLWRYFHFDVKADFYFDLGNCATNRITPLTLGDALLPIIPLCGALSFAILISTYVGRSRKLICDYFYHRYGKARTLYLYNALLRNRREYINERRTELKMLVNSQKVLGGGFDFCYTNGRRRFISPSSSSLSTKKINPFVRWCLTIVDYGKRKRCFVCHQLIRIPYVVCNTPNCALLYCEPCLMVDLDARCINCDVIQRDQDYVLRY